MSMIAALVVTLVAAGCTMTPSRPATSTDSPPPTAGATSSTEPRPTNDPAEAEQYTPAVMRVLSTPRWFTGTDGKVHLVYELSLTNGFPVPVTVTAVSVRDAEAGTVLQKLTGKPLTAAMSAMASPTTPSTELPPSSVGVVWLDVLVRDPSAVPTRIDHAVTVSVPPGLPVPSTITSVGGSAAVESRAPTAIGAPLSGTGWIALPSCCDGPHRRSVQPVNDGLWLAQRFAIDFNKINDQGLLVDRDPNKNAAWYTYDQPVLAVADAEVVAAADNYPDQIPNDPKPVGLDEADGNHVILELADGVYAFYAHLKPGSVTVKAGDQVRRGQQLGRTGNSGSSTGTHLHFQLMNQPSALLADGLPFEFDRFTLTGRSPTLEQLMASDPAKDPVTIDRAGSGERTRQLPMSRDVVAFPEK